MVGMKCVLEAKEIEGEESASIFWHLLQLTSGSCKSASGCPAEPTSAKHYGGSGKFYVRSERSLDVQLWDI